MFYFGTTQKSSNHLQSLTFLKPFLITHNFTAENPPLPAELRTVWNHPGAGKAITVLKLATSRRSAEIGTFPKIWPRFNFFRMFPRGLSLLGGSVPIKWKKHLQKTSAIVFTDLSTRLVHWTSHFGLVFQKRLLIYLNPAAGVPHGWGPLGWEFSATPIGFKKTPPSLEGAGIKNHWCWFFGWLFLPIFSWWFSFQKSNLRQEFQRSAPLKGLFHDCRQGIAGDQIWQVHDVPGTPPMFQL